MGSAPKRVIVFDLDDTLYLERDYARSGFAAVGEWARGELGLADLSAAAWDLFESGARDRVFNRVLEGAGIDPDPALVERMIGIYRSHSPRIALQPDAQAWLAANSGRHGLALITDGFRIAQNAKVEALGLRSLGFDPVIVTDEWGRDWWKPNPRAYQAVQDHFGGEPARFVYVADNPVKDFLAPRALGWHSVQVMRPQRVHAGEPPSPAHAAHCRIESLDQLDAALGLETAP